MKTKPVMIGSAVVMLVSGVALEFFPHEVLQQFGAAPAGFNVILAQIAGALYVGFAVMNWMAKGVSIGGIYARPLSIGNFAHFLIGGLALIKYAWSAGASAAIWAAAFVYLVLAALFAYIFTTNPKMAAKDNSL